MAYPCSNFPVDSLLALKEANRNDGAADGLGGGNWQACFWRQEKANYVLSLVHTVLFGGRRERGLALATHAVRTLSTCIL